MYFDARKLNLLLNNLEMRKWHHCQMFGGKAVSGHRRQAYKFIDWIAHIIYFYYAAKKAPKSVEKIQLKLSKFVKVLYSFYPN